MSPLSTIRFEQHPAEKNESSGREMKNADDIASRPEG
jgi:hypothetical protein